MEAGKRDGQDVLLTSQVQRDDDDKHSSLSRALTSQQITSSSCFTKLPSTKDVLGEHLHHKVSEALTTHFYGTEMQYPEGLKLADKITGMLMERSETDVRRMLQDGQLLHKNISKAVDSLRGECREWQTTKAENGDGENIKLSYEEIGELLYDRVSAVEEDLAPQITGMLLELDIRSLLELIECDQVLSDAVSKARSALCGTAESGQKSEDNVITVGTRHTDNKGNYSASGAVIAERKLTKSISEHEKCEEETLREILGLQILDYVAKLHPDCASNITGMMLELDTGTLETLVRDRDQLDAAVAKAFSMWTSV